MIKSVDVSDIMTMYATQFHFFFFVSFNYLIHVMAGSVNNGVC